MLKKALIATAVLAASTGIAFANGGSFQPAPPHHTGSFYIGAGISRDLGTFDQNVNIVTKRDHDNHVMSSLSTNTDSLGGDGINGELYGGYGMTFLDHYYLAIEGFGAISSLSSDIKTTVNGVTTKSSIDSDWNAGISLLPGIKITDNTLLYGRVGWKYAEFEFKNTGAKTNDQGENGIELGLGMEAMVTQNIGIRGEWDWNRFDDIKSSGAIPGLAGKGTTTTVSSKIEPTIDNFTFGIDYHFFT